MYKIIQNINSNSEYEYAHDYENIDSAIDTIAEYEQEDIDEKKGAFEYTIVNSDYEPVYTNLQPIPKHHLRKLFGSMVA